MSEAEWLVNQQLTQIATLSSEVETLQKHLKDFEKAALNWKKGYEDMERDYRTKLANAEQIIKQLEIELDEMKPREFV